MNRHFITLKDFTADELYRMMDLADNLKDRQKRGIPHRLLEGKTLGMIFEKSSTRTRVSFEAGMTQLGGHALMLSKSDTQIGRGEPVRDTSRVLSRFLDIIMIRTFAHEIVEELARWSSVPVINGLTDQEHPCQVFADLMTIRERGVKLGDMTVAWIGDSNNMANSWIMAAQIFGFTLKIASPEGYKPRDEYLKPALDAGAKVLVFDSPEKAVENADVVTTDVWTSMGQEEETKIRLAAFAGYTVNGSLMAKAKPGALFLHCLPAHRGEEVSDEVMESPNSAVWDEAENRMHIQKAIMITLLGV